MRKKGCLTAGSTCNSVVLFKLSAPDWVATVAIRFTHPHALLAFVPVCAVAVQEELGFEGEVQRTCQLSITNPNDS